jgi:hypothetical protein
MHRRGSFSLDAQNSRSCAMDEDLAQVGYAFCPTCIALQPYVHVRRDWAFPALLRCHVHESPLRHGYPMCGEDDPLPFGAPAVASILCWSCGAHLTGASLGSHVGHVNGTYAVVERVYRVALRGTSPDYALLGEATGTQFRRFVDDLLQLLAWYPSPELSPRSTDPQNLHLAFRKEILAIVGALVLNAAPASEPNGRNVRFREGLTLWLRVLALLSQREPEWIETASDLWPSALRQRLNSALDQHERSRSRSSPFRSTFLSSGIKVHQQLRIPGFLLQQMRSNSVIPGFYCSPTPALPDDAWPIGRADWQFPAPVRRVEDDSPAGARGRD